MAAIDPTQEPITDGKHPRATLKMIRVPFPVDEDDDEDDEDFDDDDVAAIERRLGVTESDEDDSDVEANGGCGAIDVPLSDSQHA